MKGVSSELQKRLSMLIIDFLLLLDLQEYMTLRPKFTSKVLLSIGGPADVAAKSNFQSVSVFRCF